MRISLADVTGVEVRPSRRQDNPWIRLPDGIEYYMLSGDVIVIRHKQGATVLPVFEAPAFADVILIRVAKAQKVATSIQYH
jgi:hypothetical protein